MEIKGKPVSVNIIVSLLACVGVFFGSRIIKYRIGVRKYTEVKNRTVEQLLWNWNRYLFNDAITKKQLLDFNLQLMYKLIDYKHINNIKVDINYDELLQYCVIQCIPKYLHVKAKNEIDENEWDIF